MKAVPCANNVIRIKNSQAKRYYGLHFYPGVAEYAEEGEAPYRVFLNENTLRKMDKTFEGRPIFVEHVDDVEPDLDELKLDADGWVIKSFYNEADGKHWVEMMIASKRAQRAIDNGLRLSNAYIPKSFAKGGLWNGVKYDKEITDAEYEHLAIVKNPRYEESVILTPEEFSKYNDDHRLELKKLSNSKKEIKMKLSFFKRQKIENTIDLEETMVILPKSKKQYSISKLVNKMDEIESKKDMHHGLADMDHKVKMQDGSYCNVSDLLKKYDALSEELEKRKKDAKGKELDLEAKEEPVDEEGDLHNDDLLESPQDAVHDEDGEHEKEVEEEEHRAELNDDESDDMHENEDEEQAEHEDEEIKGKKNKKKNELILKQAARIKADRLRNAHIRKDADFLKNMNGLDEGGTIDLPMDRLARGIQRYGSSKK